MSLKRPDFAPKTGTAERRFNFDMSEMRASHDGKHIEGYSAVFNKLSVDLGGFREQIAPGTFVETIEKDDIRGLFNHDPNFVLGRNIAKTMELKEDGTGLFMRISVSDAQWVKDLVNSIRRKDITGQSFSFRTLDDKWDIDSNEQVIRTLTRVKLFDVGPVTYPAYPDTDVGARGLGLENFGGNKLAVALRTLQAGGILKQEQIDLIAGYTDGLKSRLATRSSGQEPDVEPAGTSDNQKNLAAVALMRRKENLAAMDLALKGQG